MKSRLGNSSGIAPFYSMARDSRSMVMLTAKAVYVDAVKVAPDDFRLQVVEGLGVVAGPGLLYVIGGAGADRTALPEYNIVIVGRHIPIGLALTISKTGTGGN